MRFLPRRERSKNHHSAKLRTGLGWEHVHTGPTPLWECTRVAARKRCETLLTLREKVVWSAASSLVNSTDVSNSALWSESTASHEHCLMSSFFMYKIVLRSEQERRKNACRNCERTNAAYTAQRTAGWHLIREQYPLSPISGALRPVYPGALVAPPVY